MHSQPFCLLKDPKELRYPLQPRPEGDTDQISLLGRYHPDVGLSPLTVSHICSLLIPQFRRLNVSELPEGIQHGAAFTAILIDTPHYLPYLLKRFKTKGGVTYRATLPDIASALTVSPELASADAIVHSTGLGAREIVGDKDVFPTRGQLVIVRAPWIKGGITRLGQGVYTYTIPRKSGNVVIGGSAEANNW